MPHASDVAQTSRPKDPQLNDVGIWHIAAFYKFSPLDNSPELRADLEQLAAQLGICGSVLLAPEGLNGTIAGQGDAADKFLDRLRALPGFADLAAKWSTRDREPFLRFKAKIKKQIITMGDFLLSPDTPQGPHLSAQDWNALLADPEVVLIDTRNDYEIKIGTFKNAIDPDLENFGEFPNWIEENLDPAKHKKVAMFCTGGIRCEKASAYMLQQGFENVYQLDGGILKYLADTPQQDNLWEGECFVFDGRVSVDKDLNEGEARLCYACRQPLLPEDLEHPQYELGVSCGACYAQTSDEQKRRFRERHTQEQRARDNNERHIGKRLDLKGKRERVVEATRR